MTISLDLPDDIAVRLLARPEAERNKFAMSALREKLNAEDAEASRGCDEPARTTHEDDLRAFIANMAAKVAAGGGLERIDRAEIYADRGP